MVMGLIAGALAGAGKGLTEIANQYVKEAELAEKRAYETGLLVMKRDWDKEDTESSRLFQKERDETTFQNNLQVAAVQSQMRSAEQESQNKFTSDENAKTRAAQAARDGRKTANEQAQEELLNMRRKLLLYPEGSPERKKIQADIKDFEGKERAIPDFMKIQDETGVERPYMKTPVGLVPATILDRPVGTSPTGAGANPNTKSGRISGWEEAYRKSVAPPQR